MEVVKGFDPSQPRKCRDGLIRTYLDYTRKMESPELFHFWSIVSMIAAALGRNVWIPFGPGKVFPNLYIILVAPSGIVRKTSASDLGVDLLRLSVPELHIFEGKASINGILGRMKEIHKESGESKIFLYAGELKCLMGGLMTSSSILEDLTELYACKNIYEYHTRNAGSFCLYNTCINLLGCSTPEWLTDIKGNDFIKSGFSARILYINTKVTDRRYHRPELPEGHELMLANMMVDLRTIWMLKGEVKLTEEAERTWRGWYMDKRNFEFRDERLGPYMERKDKHMLKIATALTVNESNSMVIEKRHILGAVNALEGIEPGMLETYNQVGYSIMGQFIDKILAQIIRSKEGHVTMRELIRANYHRMNLQEINEAIKTLMEDGRIAREFVLAKNGRQVEVFKLSKDPMEGWEK